MNFLLSRFTRIGRTPIASFLDEIERAVLVDWLRSLDCIGRSAKFHSKAEPALLSKVRQYIAVLRELR